MVRRVELVGAALVTLLAAGPGCCLAAELPRGEPPAPVGPRISVVECGADPADSDHDDTAAISAAVKRATDNTTLYFPAGVYNVQWVDIIKGFTGLSLVGDGADRSVIKRMGEYWQGGVAHTWENLVAAFANDNKLLRIEDCRDMCLRDLGFDAHGTPTFGGISLNRPKRLSITRCRAFDSLEQAPLFGRDRFGFIILGFEQGSEDISFTDNVTEGLQTEMDSVNRVLVERCVFRRSVRSPGLGFLSGNFSQPDEPRDGFANRHITVRRNYFSSSRDLSMGLVTLQTDPPSNCRSVFDDVDIVDNVFVYDLDSPNGHAAVKLGTGDSSARTVGNSFAGFRIERNRIYCLPRVTLGKEFPGFIWFNCWEGEERLHGSVVRGNRLYAGAGAQPLVQITRQDQCRNLVVEDNAVEAYQARPEVGEVVGEVP